LLQERWQGVDCVALCRGPNREIGALVGNDLGIAKEGSDRALADVHAIKGGNVGVIGYPPERVQSLTPLPRGKVKRGIGDILVEFTPTEVWRHSMMFTGFARRFEDLELSNTALIRTAELADRIRELERTVAALRKPRDDGQMDLIGNA
jgi:hypothetical protein